MLQLKQVDSNGTNSFAFCFITVSGMGDTGLCWEGEPYFIEFKDSNAESHLEAI